MSQTLAAVSLLGRDYPDLGPVASVGLPRAGGLALSRGLEPKAYAHTDPNEDAALVALGESGVLLAVTDGYNGAAAAELGLGFTQRRAAALLDACAAGAGAGGEPFERAVRSLLVELREALRAVEPSRSCLLIAALVGRRCDFASFGDCSLFRGSQSTPLNVTNELVLSPTLGERKLPTNLWLGSFERADGERVALVTDGVTNFAPRPQEIAQLLASARDDTRAARAIAELALRGGAGDNVAVSVSGAPYAA
jgi:serine/threonine protein phosphatase PrpC